MKFLCRTHKRLNCILCVRVCPYQSSSPSSSKYTWGGWETSVLSWMTGRRKGYRFLLSAPRPCENRETESQCRSRKTQENCGKVLKNVLYKFLLLDHLQREGRDGVEIEIYWILKLINHCSPFPTYTLMSSDYKTFRGCLALKVLCRREVISLSIKNKVS